MSIMYCHNCKQMYGPTLFTCPSCGSGNVSRAEMQQSTEALPNADAPAPADAPAAISENPDSVTQIESIRTNDTSPSDNQRELEQILREYVYGHGCQRCSCGGLDNETGETCPDCEGLGIKDWEYGAAVTKLQSLIKQEVDKASTQSRVDELGDFIELFNDQGYSTNDLKGYLTDRLEELKGYPNE